MDKPILILNSPTFLSSSIFEKEQFKIDNEKNKTTLKKNEYKFIEKKKRGRKPKDNMYFTPETEDWMVKYINSTDVNERNYIYEKYLKYSIEKLVENVINTFKFSYINESFEDIKKEVVSHIILNIDKFDPKKGKAFSYFSIATKNYLIILNNHKYADLKCTYSIDNNTKDNDGYEFDILDESIENDKTNKETSELIKLLIEYWEKNCNNIFKKKRDIDISESVIELLRNANSVEFFNKKALYLLIREMTGYKTQYITRVLNKMQSYYKNISKEYYANGYVKEETFLTPTHKNLLPLKKNIPRKKL